MVLGRPLGDVYCTRHLANKTDQPKMARMHRLRYKAPLPQASG